MINILLTGVGGQGTVLAAKLLAQAAQSKGWQVRTAETIGMAQRGGSVCSHIRMGSDGEEVYSPLVPSESAEMIVAFEPGEAARSLSFLAPGATLVTAKSVLQPVTSSLSKIPYTSETVIDGLVNALNLGDVEVQKSALGSYRDGGPNQPSLLVVDDEYFMAKLQNRRILNTVLLAAALSLHQLPLTAQDLKDAIEVSVKPHFVALNHDAVDLVVEEKDKQF